MNVNITSKECSWYEAELKILGRTIKGTTGFSVKKEVTKEEIYGAGQHAIDIGEGNIKVSGELKLLGFESDALNRAAQAAGYDDILDVPHELVVLTAKYQKRTSAEKNYVTVTGIAFTELPEGFDQGAVKREVTLPFIAMDMSKTTL